MDFRKVGWMSTVDPLIVLFLGSHQWRISATPTMISENLGISQSHSNRRCSKLQEAGLLERTERGQYRLTMLGVDYFEGELSKAEIEALDPDPDDDE